MAKVGIFVGSVLVLLNAACFIVMYFMSMFTFIFMGAGSACALNDAIVETAVVQPGGASETTYFCERADGSRYELTGILGNQTFVELIRRTGTSIFALVALIPGMIGLIMIVLGIRSIRRSRMRAEFPKNPIPDSHLTKILETNASLSPQERQAIAEKLERIDQAKQAGRLSGREYERLRREVLSEIG